jgi:RND family efflux transporter MFP subunit
MVIILQNSGVTLRTLPVIFMLLAGYVTALAQEPVRVKIADLGDIAVYPERSAPATVISLNNTMVSAEIRAVVTDIPVNVGEVVEKGDVLLNLDCDEYNYMRSEAAAQIDALKARIKLAELKLARTEELLLKQSIAEETRDERDSELSVLRSDIRASQSRLNNAKLDVDRCTIESPFRALIKKRMASIGQFASVGTELLEIVDLDTLELSAQIFSQDTHQLHKANELMFEHNKEYYP